MTINIDGMRLERIAIDRLIPHPMNPRIDLKPGMPMYEKLKDSIERHTYIDPIIWNETSGYIVAGHQRLQVIKDLAEADGQVITELPVIVVNLDAESELTFLVSDNKITGLWDNDKVIALFDELDEDLWRYTGWDDNEIADIRGESIEDDMVFDNESGGGSKKPKTVTCPHCGKDFEL